MMLKNLRRNRFFLALAFLALLLKLVSRNENWVEAYYTYGFYPQLSAALRLLTGWLPFSLGDVLYFVAGLLLLRFVWLKINAIRKNGIKKEAGPALRKIIAAFLVVYILFNLLWGLNYNRQGIAHQLGLPVQPYSLPDAIQLTRTVQTKLNALAAQVDTVKRARLDDKGQLFQMAISVYQTAAARFPFLAYRFPSIKPSLYTGIGAYVGFTGYYNPFSGEAQLKTDIPVFLKPFVAAHEVAHQLGYAKENEANFVAFLSSKQSSDVDVLYALYYELYAYAVREVYSRDSLQAMAFKKTLHPQVARDNAVLKAYLARTQNPVEPLITRFYDQYLKWNNQKSGVQTYNEVVALLMAYAKKRGWPAI